MPEGSNLRGKEACGRGAAAGDGCPAEVHDEILIRRLANGDEEAFAAFYERHQGPIFRYALHMSGRPDTAEEVVQEAFLTLMREAGKFDTQRGAPQAFLFGIARNHLRRRAESEARYVPLAPELGVEAADGNGAGRREARAHSALKISAEQVFQEFSRAEIADRVRRAVLLLPEHYREAVTLCDLEGLDYAAAARALQCPVGTVRSRLARARDILTTKLRPMQAAIPGRAGEKEAKRGLR